MKIYHSDMYTGEYTHEGLADTSPLEPGKFIIPAGAIATPPLADKEGFAIIRNGDSWKYIPDYRGKSFWNKETKEKKEIPFGYDKEIPDTLTDIEPIEPEAEFVEDEWVIPEAVKAKRVREDRDGKIKGFNWRYERYARNERLNLVQLDDLYEMDTYIQQLADLPTQEGFPEKIEWPVYEGGFNASKTGS